MRTVKQLLTYTKQNSGAIRAWIFIIAFAFVGLWATNLLIKNGDVAKSLDIAMLKVDSFKNVNGELVTQVNIIKAESSEQLKVASEKIFNLSDREKKLVIEVSRLSMISNSVRMSDTIYAGYTDTTKYDFDNISCDSLAEIYQYAVFTPAPFEYNSDSISLKGIVLTDGVAIHDVVIDDTLTTRDVKLKSGFLGFGRKYSTQIHHSNQLFRTDSAAVYIVDKTPGWWYKTGKPVIAAGVSSLLTYLIVNALIHK